MDAFEIRFNGEPKVVKSTSVDGLLKELGLQDKRVAVELNREIVSRGSYSETPVQSGDSVEVVHFVGGG